MAGSVGLNECCEHSVAGTDFLAFDKVESGAMDYDGGEWKENIGIGGQVAGYRDMVTPVGNVSTMLQSATLLAHLKPATVGALPAIIEKIQGGVAVTTDGSRLHEDCYIRTWKFSCAKGGVVMADYSWGALSETEKQTIASPVTKQTAVPYVWHAETPTFGAADALSCQSWEVSGETGVTFETSQDAKISTVQRLPEWVEPGLFAVKLTATVRVDPAISMIADWPSTYGFKVIATNGTGTFTIDMTGSNNVQMNKDPIQLVNGKNAVLYQIEGQIITNDLDACLITLV